MRALRLAATATVVVAVLSGLGGVAVAQDTPDADQAVSGEAAYFDGTVVYPGRYLTGTSEAEDLKLTKRGDGWEFRDVELSDPRVSGTWRAVNNEDSYYAAGGVWTQARRIDNAAGSWLGDFTGYRSPSGRWMHQGTLTGSGAYEGLSAIVFMEDTGQTTYHVHGMVFPGGLPETPDYPERAD